MLSGSKNLLATALLLFSGATSALPNQSETHATPPGPYNMTFITKAINVVNGIRAQHSAQSLAWSIELASAAQAKANACVLSHSGPYGENAYWRWSTPW
ncbi:hypothetical protein B0H63DRAFT_466177 [Podospora didyma]|uniref:SCP domain-containing protein n=1 Tax=Podospora didyma TaxID=330526 RepID=A0AAE0U4L6_9PEZI|nr:hypothetical protein B0H63DRAFT_466177 [Podospora didyma]